MNYHNILKNDMNNGDGLRCTLFVSFCPHHCEGCQNPQTWNENSGIFFDDNAKQEIFSEISKSYISGVTLSGGDPLGDKNLKDIYNLVREIRKKFSNTKSIWIYSGYTYEEIISYKYRYDIIKLCDILVDGKFVKTLYNSSYHWAGSSNQRVIDIQKSLCKNKIVLYDN